MSAIALIAGTATTTAACAQAPSSMDGQGTISPLPETRQSSIGPHSGRVINPRTGRPLSEQQPVGSVVPDRTGLARQESRNKARRLTDPSGRSTFSGNHRKLTDQAGKPRFTGYSRQLTDRDGNSTFTGYTRKLTDRDGRSRFKGFGQEPVMKGRSSAPNFKWRSNVDENGRAEYRGFGRQSLVTEDGRSTFVGNNRQLADPEKRAETLKNLTIPKRRSVYLEASGRSHRPARPDARTSGDSTGSAESSTEGSIGAPVTGSSAAEKPIPEVFADLERERSRLAGEPCGSAADSDSSQVSTPDSGF